MAKKVEDAQAKLKGKLAGGLFRYTFMISVVFHAGILVVAPSGDDEGDGKPFIVVETTYEDLPPPPSIEQPEPEQAPKGLEVKGAVGEVPLPVPDGEGADTWYDGVERDESKSFGEGTKIIVVEDTGANPWDTVTMAEYSESPSIVYEKRPIYPDIARDSSMEGDVVLLVYIDERGDVRRAIVQSSPGLPALEEAATKAAYKCKFRPAERQGTPVGVWYNLVMQFRL